MGGPTRKTVEAKEEGGGRMPVAYCTICEEDKEVVDRVTPKARFLELECGHVFDWETGECHKVALGE